MGGCSDCRLDNCVGRMSNRRVTLISETAQAPTAIVIKHWSSVSQGRTRWRRLRLPTTAGRDRHMLTHGRCPIALAAESRIYFACSFPPSG
jgi:hypothetical protein